MTHDRLGKAGRADRGPIHEDRQADYVPLNPVAMAILKRRYEAVDKDGKSTPATPPTSSRGAAGSSPQMVTKAFRQARAKAAWRTFASTP